MVAKSSPAIRLAALGLLISLGGCQSWFYIPGREVLPRWDQLIKQRAKVDLYVAASELAAPAPASALGPPVARPSKPLTIISLTELLPARPPFLLGLRRVEEHQESVSVDYTDVLYANALLPDNKKPRRGILIGLAVAGLAVLPLTAITFALALVGFRDRS